VTATADLLAGYRELNDSRDALNIADDFYEGAGIEVFANRRVKRLFARLGVETVEDFAYAAIPVKVISAGLRQLLPAVSTATGTPAEQAEQRLHDLIERNELGPELRHLWKLVSRYGDAYLLVWPVRDERDRIVDVDIVVNSPHTTRAIYDPEQPLRIAYVIRSWQQGAAVRANIYYSDRVEKWWCPPGCRPDNPELWERWPEDPDDIPVEGGRVPFFHFRNDRPYGAPEHEATYGPQRLLNKLVSSLGAITDFQVAPQRYYMADAKVDDPLQNFTDPDEPDDDDEDPQGETDSPLSSDPQSVWKLYGRNAGQFEPADPERILKPFDRCIQAMSELSGIPRHHFGWGTGETPSGAALRTLDRPRVEIVDDRKDAYGPTLRGAYEYALALLGVTDVRVAVRWRPTMVITDLEGWQIVAAKVASGVPARHALIEAGYLPENVDAWLQDASGSSVEHRLQLLQLLITVAGGGKPAAAPAAAPAAGAQPSADAPLAGAQSPAKPPPADAPLADARPPQADTTIITPELAARLLDRILAGMDDTTR